MLTVPLPSVNPHAESYNSILNLLKAKTGAEDVLSHLDTLKSSLLDSSPDFSDSDAEDITRKMTIQALLSIGSRSFSHLLNAIERYLPLLRSVAGNSRDSTASSSTTENNKPKKAAILKAVTDFWWKSNTQMVNIVFDKLMQYQIVEPVDIVQFVFGFLPPREVVTAPVGEAPGVVGIDARKWDLLEGALAKANGRVVAAKTKLAGLKTEEVVVVKDEKMEESTSDPALKKEDEMDVDAAAAAAVKQGMRSWRLTV